MAFIELEETESFLVAELFRHVFVICEATMKLQIWTKNRSGRI